MVRHSGPFSVFFSLPVDPNSQYLFTLTWNNQYYTGQSCLGGSMRPLVISPERPTESKAPPGPREVDPLQYGDSPLLCSAPKNMSLKHFMYLPQHSAKKGHQVFKGKLQ